jgi:hypothetical protein
MTAGVVVRGNFPADLKPVVDAWWGQYNMQYEEWKQLFEMHESDQAFELDVLKSGFTYIPMKPEAQATQYGSWGQEYSTFYNHNAYGYGFQVSREARKDGKTLNIMEDGMRELGDAMRRTYETLGANIFNYGTNSSVNVGGDGQPLFSASHPTLAGNQSNILSSAASLSETSLETLLIQIDTDLNFMGMVTPLSAKKLIIPPALQFTAERILGSILQSDTANNNINAIRQLGMFPGGTHINHYLTSSTAYYILTGVSNGLKYFNRESPEFSDDGAFDQEVTKYKVYFRCAFGWTDFRAAYASTGIG